MLTVICLHTLKGQTVFLMGPPHINHSSNDYDTKEHRGSIDSRLSKHPIISSPHRPLLTDHWEIPYEELKVFDSQPLGRGAFGEVLKGHICSQVAKPQSSGVKHLPKFSLTCTVAVKKPKGE